MSDVGDVNQSHSVGVDGIDALLRACRDQLNPSTSSLVTRMAYLELARPHRIVAMGDMILDLQSENKRLFSLLMDRNWES